MARAKKTLRVAALLLIGAAAVALTMYYTFRAGLLNEPVLRFALAETNERLRAEVLIDAVEGDILSGFTVRGLTLVDPAGRKAIEVISARGELSFPSLLQPSIDLRAEGGALRLYKRDGDWNLTGLSKKQKPPRTESRTLPPVTIDVELVGADLEISWAEGRLVKSRIGKATAYLAMSGPDIGIVVEELEGTIVDPPIEITGARGKGRVSSVGPKWEVAFEQARIDTPTTWLDARDMIYRTADSTMAAELPALSLAPDTLAHFWPTTPLAAPIEGKGKIEGTTDDLGFEVTVTSSAGAVDGKGRVKNKGQQVEIKGEMKDFALGEFLEKDTDISGLFGNFDVVYAKVPRSPASDARGDGTNAGPAGGGQSGGVSDGDTASLRYVKANLELAEFHYQDYKSFPMLFGFALKGDRYAASIFSSEPGADMVVNLDGGIADPKPVSAQCIFYDLDPNRIKNDWPASKLAGVFKLKGEGRSLETFIGWASLGMEPSKVGNTEIETAEFRANVREGRVSFERAEIAAMGAEVTGDGHVMLGDKSYPFSLDLEARVGDPEDVAALLGGKFKADSLAAKGLLRGNKNRWNFNGSAELINVTSDYIVAETADLKLGLAGRGGSSLSGDVSLLARAAKIPKSEYKDFKLRQFNLLADIELKPAPPKAPNVVFSARSETYNDDFGFKGEGAFKMTGGGNWTLDFNKLDLRVIAREYRLKEPAALESRGGRVSARGVTISGPGESLAVEGAFLGPSLDLDLKLESFDVKPWAEKLMPDDVIEGRVSGTMKMKGSGSDPSVDIEWALGDPRYGSVRLDKIEAVLNIAEGKMVLSGKGSDKIAGDIEADGFLPVNVSLSPFKFEFVKEGAMELNVLAPEIPAESISELVPWVRDSKGRMSLNARLRGTMGKPIWNGYMSMKRVSFNVPQWGLNVSDLQGDVNIADNQATLSEMSVASGPGRATLEGNFRLDGFSLADMDLTLKADNFKAMNTPDITAVLDAKLRIRGNLEYPRLKGDVAFRDLVYRPPLLLQYQGSTWEEEDTTVTVKGRERKAEESSSLFDRGLLNIDISIPDTGQLRNSELNVRFGGDLSLRKPPGGFYLLFGKVEAKEGWITFQGKPFRVERGVFQFPAIPAIDPDLDILASYRVPDYKTYIKIGGMLSEPTLEIYSEPPLEQADVLSVILFGKPVSELAEGQRQSLADAGGALVAGYAAQGLAQSLADALNVDTVILQPGESAETSGVGFGSYLTDRLYLFYYHHFGEEAREEFRLRFEIMKNLFIEGGQDEEGQGGADIFFSYPFGKPGDKDRGEKSEDDTVEVEGVDKSGGEDKDGDKEGTEDKPGP